MKPHFTHTMNPLRHILLTLALLAFAASSAAQTPAQSAYDHLTQAKAALEESSSVQRPKRTVKRVENQLSQALSGLELVKNNRGSALPLAKKAIEAAQTEIAKGYSEEVRMKTLAFIEEAMKQTTKAIDVKRR